MPNTNITESPSQIKPTMTGAKRSLVFHAKTPAKLCRSTTEDQVVKRAAMAKP
jgi:hypothetical protein